MEKLVGIVRHRKLLGQQTRYGIEFDMSQRVKVQTWMPNSPVLKGCLSAVIIWHSALSISRIAIKTLNGPELSCLNRYITEPAHFARPCAG